MKTKSYHYLLFLVIFFFTFPVYSSSPVWVVQKGSQKLFIGGTIHVLSPLDYPLPQSFESAFNQSEKLIFETDIQKIKQPEFLQPVLNQLIVSNGLNLKQTLSKETYQALEKFCLSRAIPISVFMNLKPGIVAMILTMMELQRLGLTGTGVDEFYSIEATKHKKELGQLETIEEQFAFILSMGEGYEDEIIARTLQDIEQLPETMELLKDIWRKGDVSQLNELVIIPFRKDFPHTYDALLVNRNNAWIPQIEAMLETKEVEFLLVGALHLAGDDGLLALLESKGYKIQQM